MIALLFEPNFELLVYTLNSGVQLGALRKTCLSDIVVGSELYITESRLSTQLRIISSRLECN